MTLRVITMFGDNITWYNKKNFFIITCYNVYVSSMGFKSKSSITWYNLVMNCLLRLQQIFFVLTAVFQRHLLYVITDNVDILHLVHMFACYSKEAFEFCMLTFRFKSHYNYLSSWLSTCHSR